MLQRQPEPDIHPEAHAPALADWPNAKDVLRVLEPTHSRARVWTRKFVNEFRFIILTVLVVLGALTLQRSLEEMLRLYVQDHIVSPYRRVSWMVCISLVMIVIVIIIVLAWKPMPIIVSTTK